MVATLTWNLDANGMTFATSFSITTQARRVRTGRIKFSCLGRLLWAGLFASVCSPPRLSTTQLTLATRSGHVSTGLGLSPVSFMFSSSHVAETLVSVPRRMGQGLKYLLRFFKWAAEPFRTSHMVRSSHGSAITRIVPKSGTRIRFHCSMYSPLKASNSSSAGGCPLYSKISRSSHAHNVS